MNFHLNCGQEKDTGIYDIVPHSAYTVDYDIGIMHNHAYMRSYQFTSM